MSRASTIERTPLDLGHEHTHCVVPVYFGAITIQLLNFLRLLTFNYEKVRFAHTAAKRLTETATPYPAADERKFTQLKPLAQLGELLKLKSRSEHHNFLPHIAFFSMPSVVVSVYYLFFTDEVVGCLGCRIGRIELFVFVVFVVGVMVFLTINIMRLHRATRKYGVVDDSLGLNAELNTVLGLSLALSLLYFPISVLDPWDIFKNAIWNAGYTMTFFFFACHLRGVVMPVSRAHNFNTYISWFCRPMHYRLAIWRVSRRQHVAVSPEVYAKVLEASRTDAFNVVPEFEVVLDDEVWGPLFAKRK
jgi:hypothetical protein